MFIINLRDKVAIITGANNSFGIGAATVLKFAKAGAKVVLTYKIINHAYDKNNLQDSGLDLYYKFNSETCDEVEKKLKEITNEYLILEADISKQSDILKIFDETERKFGQVDILVNNAATGEDADTIFNVTNDVIDETFGVNVKGTILMIREFVKRYKEKGLTDGRIVNLSSDNASLSFAGQITYGASKAAIESLTRSIACEVGNLGVTVNAVAPGPTQTAWIDETLEKQVLPNIPLGRLGTPEDIANMILFLASENASWITGQTIKVSGGHELK